MRFSSAGKSTWTWYYVVERCRFQRDSRWSVRVSFSDRSTTIDPRGATFRHDTLKIAVGDVVQCICTRTRHFLSNRTRLTAKIAGEKYRRGSFARSIFHVTEFHLSDWESNICFCRFLNILFFSINLWYQIWKGNFKNSFLIF